MTDQIIINWAVLGPGRIAKTFVNDLLHSKDKLRPEVNSGKIKHQLIAVASHSSLENAERFKKDSIHEETNDLIKCYGNYDEVLNNPKVDIVYTATVNSTHFSICYQALQHNKNVLMEKPFTVNHKQAEILTALAKKKNLFLMEAYWTRYNPVYQDVYKYLFTDNRAGDESSIGDIKRIVTDLSYVFDEADPQMNRIYNPALGGGVLLDIGIYALYWVLGFIGKPGKKLAFPQINASAALADTGVDISTAAVLKFENGKLGVSSCSGYFTNEAHRVLINGTKGSVEVDDSCRPNEYWIYDENHKLVTHKAYTYDGKGMFFEADHVALCLAKGLKESPLHTMDDALLMSNVLDTIRDQINNRYPDNIESTDIA